MLPGAKVDSKLLEAAGTLLETLMTDGRWGPLMETQVQHVTEYG